MKITPLILTAILASLTGITGCTNSTAQGKYPDQSVATKAQAQAIRDDAQQRNQTIDRDRDLRLTALSFRSNQAEQKTKQDREQIAISLDQNLQPLKAKQDDAKSTGERERERIDHEGDGAPANTDKEAVIRIKADAEERKVKSLRLATEVIADNEAKILVCRNDAAKRMAKVDEVEASEKAAITKERTDVEQQARERALAVSVETTSKLDKLGERSANRRAEDDKQMATAANQDEHVAASVRSSIARGDATRDVTVSVHEGVVVLTGIVSNDTIRRDVIADTTKVPGVITVDDKLNVR